MQVSQSNFDRAFGIVVGLEGGYVNDPRDPGGETKYGISKRSYPDLDIASLTIEDAKLIYLRDYWGKAGCDALQYPMDVIVFDSAVNQGVAQALHQLAAYKTPAEYLAFRALVYTENKNFDRYGRGWFNRLFHIAQQVFSG